MTSAVRPSRDRPAAGRVDRPPITPGAGAAEAGAEERAAMMRMAVLSAGSGWHVRALQRAAALLGHAATAVDFRRLSAGVAGPPPPLADFDAVLVRTMPPGSLEQVVFRMDL